jgi:hypothetical protein
MNARQRESPPSSGSFWIFVQDGSCSGGEHLSAGVETKRGDGRDPMISEPSASFALDGPQPTGNRR